MYLYLQLKYKGVKGSKEGEIKANKIEEDNFQTLIISN